MEAKHTHSHGCCADEACNDKTCMELPAGKTCGHCVHERRCCAIFGHTPTDTYCDWFPRRFKWRKPFPSLKRRGAYRNGTAAAADRQLTTGPLQ